MWYCNDFGLLLFFIVGISQFVNPLIINEQSSKIQRQKRFVVFPQGSSFSCSISQSVYLIVGSPLHYSEGCNLHTVYDLPKNVSLYNDLPRALVMRKKRSDLYESLETFMNLNQMDGKACIYRTLCEVAQRLTKKNFMFEEFLNVLFHFPIHNISDTEPKHHHKYISARILGLKSKNCEKLYPSCPFSLLNMQPEFL